MLRVVALLAALASAACVAAPRIEDLRLPAGFRISIYAENVRGARSLALGERGTLFAGSRGGNVYAVPAGGGAPAVIASGLDAPHGVAFRDGALYVGEVGRVLRYDGIEDHLRKPPKPTVVIGDLPRERHHGLKTLRFGPDGMLYIGIGSPCNVCEPGEGLGNISRLDLSGGKREIFARGIRNSVGFDWDPKSRELWFTDNGADNMGNDVPSDELNHAPRAGMNFGFPYCHQGDVADSRFGARHACKEFTPPARKLGAHVASLGMRFYTGSKFPQEYRGAIFIAEHGSWNRNPKSGYRISVVKLAGGKAVSYEPFAEGWLQGDEAWGRPVDVIVAPDGALLVSDDSAGVIYRIDYAAR
ncbi:MAG: sorbosone dehydrogenase family protein [Betaproteobacteria bacterium]|nr:MAG: sorbosone dehydrogenase family protein [Betaproteobacteria bacterium]